MPNQHPYENEWEYTDLFAYEHGGEWLGRELIIRDSRINGGVQYGTYGGEAIVVDSDKYPEQYDRYYDQSKEQITENGVVERSQVLRAVFDTVKNNMAYSQFGVDSLLDGVARSNGLRAFADGTKVDLSAFMAAGVGVCRHQALVAGALLEKYKDEGYIRGEVSVDRNMNFRPTGESRGGHAWVRYTTNKRNIFILDVAQNYFGSLENASNKAKWNYLRPEEQRSSNKNFLLGGTALQAQLEKVEMV